MEPDKLMEIANRLRVALKAKDGGEYNIGDVRAFTRDEALTIVAALERCAEIETATELEEPKDGIGSSRYVFFAVPAAHYTAKDEKAALIRGADSVSGYPCNVIDESTRLVALDTKRGRAIKIF